MINIALHIFRGSRGEDVLGKKRIKTAKKKRSLSKRAASKSGNRWLWPLIIGLVLIAILGVWWSKNKKQEGETSELDIVRLETGKGPIVLEVYTGRVPVTAGNFLDLVQSGFYQDFVWHRVEDWVIQTGDPTVTGGEDSAKTIKLEIDPALKNTRGAVGMARTPDPDSASSQFYILKTDASWLDGDYSVFARVKEGMDVVDQIEKGDAFIKAAFVAAD